MTTLNTDCLTIIIKDNGKSQRSTTDFNIEKLNDGGIGVPFSVVAFTSKDGGFDVMSPDLKKIYLNKTITLISERTGNPENFHFTHVLPHDLDYDKLKHGCYVHTAYYLGSRGMLILRKIYSDSPKIAIEYTQDEE